MLLGISSAQGQGKSTILSSLKERGYDVPAIQTSRSILQEWGITLSDLDREPDLRIKFQERLIDDHHFSILEYATSNEVHFIERTFADIFTYTVLAVGSFNEYSDWLDSYYSQCEKYQQIFNKVFFIEGRTPDDIENDGVRSINKHFVGVVENRIKHYVNEMGNDSRIVNINTPVHKERMQKILEVV